MNSRYQIVGEINQGGVGVVLKAWDTKLQRHVAIKRFLSTEQRMALGNMEGDLLQEASTLSSLHHPNIVSVFDVDMDAETGPEVIMEYLNGQDLEQAVAQAALTLEDFYQVAQQTLDALSNAHRMNLLHRDIKPSNIQVTWLANGKFVSKFVDFGLAKFFEKPSKQTVRQDGTVLGSIYYMAPEQFERQPLDHRSDLYSLGCVFYFALSMHRPHEGETVMDVINAHLAGRPVRIRDYRPNVPRELEKWVEWLMSRLPDSRPSDAELALSTLRQIMAGQLPEGVPGVRVPSQPVTAAPMRTGDVKVPQTAAFGATAPAAVTVATPVPKPRPAAARTAKPAAKKKPASGAGKPLLVGGLALVGAIAAFTFLSGGRKPKETVEQEPKPTASGIFEKTDSGSTGKKPDAATADAQARMAVESASPTKSALVAGTRDVSQPPSDGLLMRFDAGRGTRSDASGKPSFNDGPAAQWTDIAPMGGYATLQYSASSTEGRERHYPTLRTAPAGAGLKAARPVVAFDGAGDTLCIRDRDKVGDKMESTLDGGSVTVLMVFRATGPDAPEGLLVARDTRRKTMWSIGVQKGGLVAGPASAAPLVIAGSEESFRIASFTLDASIGKIHLCLINHENIKASIDTDLKVDTSSRLEMLRMGTSDGSNERGRSVFAGEVAEILIYNKALERETRHDAENYLRLKYFGASGPTVTANSKR